MAFWTLYRKETAGYFISPIAYIVLFACALAIAVTFQITFTVINNSGLVDITVLSAAITFPLSWMVLLVQIPMITMRAFAEELKLGTMEMLLTAPVREWEVVLAKYCGALTFFSVLWAPLFLDIVVLHFLSDPQVPIYWASVGTTFLGMFLLGMLYTAIGIFTSSLSRNQIVAAMLCFVIIFTLFAFSLFPFLNMQPWALSLWGVHFGTLDIPRLAEYVSAMDQMKFFSLGIFDTRPIVFCVSGTALMLFLTQRLLLARRVQN